MAAIGTCYLLERDALRARIATGDWETVIGGARQLDYRWSGDVLVAVIAYLGTQGVKLGDFDLSMTLTSIADASCTVLDHEHRRIVDALDVAKHDPARLRAYYEELIGASSEFIEPAMVDGLRFLRDVLGQLSENTVALVVIG